MNKQEFVPNEKTKWNLKKIKAFLLKFKYVLIITNILLVIIITAWSIYSNAKYLSDTVIDNVKTTVQFGSAPVISIDAEISYMPVQEKFIDIDSVRRSQSTQFVHSSDKETIIIVPAGKTFPAVLPDGSKVLLNSMSELRYTTSLFKTTKREIHLQGEAFFEVEPDDKRPFSVVTSEGTITALSTAFNVKCHKGDSSCEVALRNGKVMVDSHRYNVILSPGQGAILIRGEKIKEMQYDPTVIFGWLQGIYILNKPLPGIIKDLERIYGEKFMIDRHDLANKTFFVPVYKNKPLNVLLEELHDHANDSLNYYKGENDIWHFK